MSQAEGLARTLEALEVEGVLSQIPPAVVALAEGLAAELDSQSNKDTGRAALWREYRAAVTGLLEASSDTSDDDTASFLVSIQTPGRAKVGNAPQS